MRNRSITQPTLPIVGFAFFAVVATVFGLTELVAGRYAWAGMMMAGIAVSAGAMRLQVAKHIAATGQARTRPRPANRLERAVQLLWAFAAGAAAALAVTHYGAANPEAGIVCAVAAAVCALGLAATLTAEQALCRHRGV